MVRPLPRIMVAPNGARRTKADHPALPITDAEIIETARDCRAAGADGIHLHIRDEQGGHLLEAARYRALLDQLGDEVPDMYLQVTSEAADRYEAAEQCAMIRDLQPAHVSVALHEIVSGADDLPKARDFYHWASDAGVAIQHILYSPDDVRQFVKICDDGHIPGRFQQVIFVQGRYAGGPSETAALKDYLEPLSQNDALAVDWMVCAFGVGETDSLAHALRMGGKVRVGFENSLWRQDGTLAKDNAERVSTIAAIIG